MDYSKPTLLAISGPNGAGKSTHIQSMLPAEFEGLSSFDRDKARTVFGEQLSRSGEPAANIPARAGMPSIAKEILAFLKSDSTVTK
jgi:predicted ABC-type ATPase